MTPNTSWCFNVDTIHLWAYLNDVFSPDECQKIIEIGESKNPHKGTVKNKDFEGIRDSYISWLYPTDMDWAYRRLTDAVLSLNNQYFNFQLSGFMEGFQFTRYDAPSGFYGMHTDRNFNDTVRKLSISIQLTNPDLYEGGDLEVQCGSALEAMGKEQGKLIAFPSFVPHQVKPVTKGTRYSLVAWVSGDPFR